MMPLTFPTVHLNGTSRDELDRQLTEAIDAARPFLAALEACAPNARDYYPQGPTAYAQAAKEHTERVHSVARVLKELDRVRDMVLST